MKRLRLLVVLGVVAAALPLGLSVAHATGGGGGYPPPPNSVAISDVAQYELGGTYITVGLSVRCQPYMGNTLGTVDVTVTQQYPETPYPQGAFGVGTNNVVCDNASHYVAVSVPLGVFDAGKAYATADLNPLIGNKASAKRWITIVHV